MIPYPVTAAFEIQRTEWLLDAIAEWRASFGKPEHARDRRYAMALIEVARVRRNLRRAEVQAAVNRNAMRRQAA